MKAAAIFLSVLAAGILVGIMIPSPEEIIMWRISLGHQYVYDIYTCNNFTKDVVEELNGLGYEVYYVTGKVGWNESEHAWVKICKDYDVTQLTRRATKDYEITAIINITEGRAHGTICPWMRNEAWENWCEEEFG